MNRHNNNLYSAIRDVRGTLEANEEIHQVFSWDTGVWAFVVLDGTDDWKVLVHDGWNTTDISAEFSTCPTINKTYAEDNVL